MFSVSIKLFLIFCLVTTSCVTSRQKKLDRTPGAPLVKQVGISKPTISKRKRKQWVDISSHPKSHVLRRAVAALAIGEHAPAEQMVRKFLTKKPGHPRALEILAASLAMQAKYEMANYYGTLLKKKEPHNPTIKNIEALTIMNRTGIGVQEFKQAEGLFQSAYDSHSKQLAAGLNLGYLYLETGRARSSIDTFESVANRCRNCAAALIGIGISASRLKDWKKAKAALTKVLDNNPDNPRALFYLASIYKTGYNNNAKAMTQLERLLALSSPSAVALRKPAQSMYRSLRGEEPVKAQQPAKIDAKD